MIHFRGVERSDLDALFVLDQQCFRPGIAYSRSDLWFYLNHPRSSSVLAEDQATKSLLGFVIAQKYLEEGRCIGHIITIDVTPSERRKGLGRSLMDSILVLLAAARVVTVRLEVATDNLAALAFYRRLGFSATGKIRGFYMGTIDALVMEKSLKQADPQTSPLP